MTVGRTTLALVHLSFLPWSFVLSTLLCSLPHGLAQACSAATLSIPHLLQGLLVPASKLMRYQKDSDLGEGVICGITVVAFSPDGLHLAAGGKDCKLCVWRISDGTLLHVFTTASPIFSLLWIPDCEGVIVCGMEDGTLSNVVTGKVSRCHLMHAARMTPSRLVLAVQNTRAQLPSKPQLRRRTSSSQGESSRFWCAGRACSLEEGTQRYVCSLVISSCARRRHGRPVGT